MAEPLTPERVRADVAQILGEPVQDIDPGENLLERGLDSVRLMSLMETWRAAGVETDFADLAEKPTVNAWASLLVR
ncbi:phosphopantetheine-binding protein [Nocardiopsis sp. NPDC058631]|uniref:phosphopantetheine-binding protein n=1 Tax=Nocardiopsis sp. NPDC058631 TaxID=3346566 RepID=UPI00364A1A0F